MSTHTGSDTTTQGTRLGHPTGWRDTLTAWLRHTPPAAPPAGSGIAAATTASVEVTPRHVRVGDGYAATLIVTGYPAEVGPAWLEPLLSWPGRLDLALHIDPIPNPVAAARLRAQRARLESTRRADTAKGRLGDPAVDAAADDAADLAERLARGAAKLFKVGLYLTVHARTREQLAEACEQVKAAAASTLLDVQPATWRHLHGWTTTLPLAHDGLGMRRTMDTAALAAAFPLASPDLPAPLPGETPATGGVLYGVNPDSRGVIWWDRFGCDNYNRRRIPAPRPRRRRDRRPPRRRRGARQPARPAGRRHPPRRAHPTRPVPPHPHLRTPRVRRRRARDATR